MPITLEDIIPIWSCRHMTGRQLLLCLVGYSLVFSLLALTFLNGTIPGYFRQPRKEDQSKSSAQLLRQAPGDQQQDNGPNGSTNFVFRGNVSQTDKNISDHDKEVKKASPVGRTFVKVPDDHIVRNFNDRTGESVAAENAALKGKSLAFVVHPHPSTVQYYHSVIDNEPFMYRYNTCAIVSSSGQLLGKNAGPEIDSADCVIRMNVAPVKGFEDDVGSRTTIRIACFISSHQLSSQADAVLRGVGAPEIVLFWGLEAPQSKNKLQAVPKVRDLQKKFMDIKFYSHRHEGELAANRLFEKETGVSRKDTNSWLSTGWFTVMTALDICQHVRIYGMVPDDHCVLHEDENVKYHYFQSGPTPTECTYYKVHEATPKGGHRFMTEKAIFARWATIYNMTFHHPEWNRSADEVAKKLDTPFTKLLHIKGLKYFQRRYHTRREVADKDDTLTIMLCILVVLGIPGLLVCIGCLVAVCAEEDEDEMPRYHGRYRRYERSLQHIR